MKFITTQENLHQGLLLTSHINTKHINLPILNNVLLKVENSILYLSSTNLEVAITTKIRGKSEEEGNYTVPAKLFGEYISLLPKDNINLFLKDGFLNVSTQNSMTKIKGQEASDFPLIPQIEKKHSFYLDGPAFKKALNQVSFVVLPSETRPEISGVYFNFNSEEDILTLVATDSFRLAEKKIKLEPTSAKNNVSIIVPLRTIWELVNILSYGGGENNLLEISLDEGQLFINYNNTELISRLVIGMFPDYQQIIPQEFNTKIIMPRGKLQLATKSASLFSRSGLNDIKFNFLTSPDTAEVYSTDNQTGEQKTRIEAKISGISNKIVLNHKYLDDGLSNLGGEELELSIIDENSPCLLRSLGEANYLYVVMPIKQ